MKVKVARELVRKNVNGPASREIRYLEYINIRHDDRLSIKYQYSYILKYGTLYETLFPLKIENYIYYQPASNLARWDPQIMRIPPAKVSY